MTGETTQVVSFSELSEVWTSSLNIWQKKVSFTALLIWLYIKQVNDPPGQKSWLYQQNMQEKVPALVWLLSVKHHSVSADECLTFFFSSRFSLTGTRCHVRNGAMGRKALPFAHTVRVTGFVDSGDKWWITKSQIVINYWIWHSCALQLQMLVEGALNNQHSVVLCQAKYNFLVLLNYSYLLPYFRHGGGG